jgi:hypothetical protein
VVSRPFPAAPFVVHRGAVFIYGGAQAVARERSLCAEGTSPLRPAIAHGAAQVVERGAQAVARGAIRCASRVLDRGA